MNKYSFPCGCEFDVVDENIKECDGLPSIFIDYYNIREDCPATWELIQSGHTKGIFQLESNLGRKWSKQLLPTNIDEMSALISLIRPGCLRSIVDGKSMTQQYCDRKNCGEEVKYFHEALEPILKETYGVLIYQEENIRIAQDIAGFNLQEADVLRKSIGHKDAESMSKVKTVFLKGCDNTKVVTTEEAEEIFGWIKESQKYQFNKSHGISYSDMGYWSAYVKAHFPLHFYTAWLYYAHEKMDPQEEMQLLVSDARYFDIDIRPPSLSKLRLGNVGHFALDKDSVYFGIGDIKRIGEALVNKVISNVEKVEAKLGKTIDKWDWSDFLIHFSDTVSQTVINGVINAGATDYMPGSRIWKVHQYNSWLALTQKERDWIRGIVDIQTSSDLSILISSLLYNKERLSKPRKVKIAGILTNLEKTPYSLEDTASYIAGHETELLGIPITCSKLDTCHSNIEANSTCKDFLQGKTGNISIAVEIIDVREYIIKKGNMKGRKMLYLNVEDSTASMDSVTVFPSVLESNEPLFIKGSTLILTGKRDGRNNSSFIVDKVLQI
jgi:DNA polymerase-3 subunit alpha